MLKIEKTTHSSGLIINFRKKERFFESRFLIALGLALLFHIGGLILFHITPFSFTSNYIFPPVKVDSSHPVQGMAAIANLVDNEEDLSPPLPRMIPTLEIASLIPPSDLTPTRSLNPNTFQQIEERFWPMAQSSLNFDLKEPRIQMHISGPLAEQRLIESDLLLTETVPVHLKAITAYVSYQVRMNGETGELFWLERTESSGKSSVDQLAEKIAFHLRFKPTFEGDFIEGTLSFAFAIPQGAS